MGLCSPILTNVVLGDIPPQDAGAGSGVVNAVIQFGTAAGITIVGVIFFSLTGSEVAGADRAEGFGDATSVTLWYNVAVLTLVALLSPLLPASKTPQAAPAAPAAETPAESSAPATKDRLLLDTA
ncbi:hypothetical protein [Streptomyces sp. NPDC097981]|uniref:hypothetical protein n=1 Tax=Streptomyces sp. NPDC097981 TaxID=3155428 RepID=UPI0033308DBD